MPQLLASAVSYFKYEVDIVKTCPETVRKRSPILWFIDFPISIGKLTSVMYNHNRVPGSPSDFEPNLIATGSWLVCTFPYALSDKAGFDSLIDTANMVLNSDKVRLVGTQFSISSSETQFTLHISGKSLANRDSPHPSFMCPAHLTCWLHSNQFNICCKALLKSSKDGSILAQRSHFTSAFPLTIAAYSL